MHIVDPDIMNNENDLKRLGEQMGKKLMTNSVAQAGEIMKQKITELENESRTALGPALLTSIAMASNGAPGSAVILCTDGESNEGVGNIYLGKIDESKKENIKKFYKRVGDYAKANDVVVHLVSIIGDECDLTTLTNVPI